MSATPHVVGFKPADAKFKKMKAALDACLAIKATPPLEVRQFFGPDWEEGIDERGIRVDLEKAKGVTEWKEEMQDGFEIDLRLLDPDIKILRCYTSY